MQCPACGATNPDAAAWCGQCYRRFGDDAASPPAPNAAGPAPATQPAPTGQATQGFRRQDGELQWECPECGMFNDIALSGCAACGTSLLQRFRSDEPPPPQNWGVALLLSAVVPGAGHLSIGRYGTGWARLVLFVAWVVGALLLASSAGSGALIVATPLLLGALVLWALTMLDLYRLQQGEAEILVGRTFLWLVVGVLLLMAVALFGSVGSVTTPPG